MPFTMTVPPNILLGYFVGRPELPPAEIVRSLEILANRAQNRLQRGWDEFAVRRQWPYAYGNQVREKEGADESLPKPDPNAENDGPDREIDT